MTKVITTIINGLKKLNKIFEFKKQYLLSYLL